MSLLPAIEQETAPNPDSAIIWLHGLGADGNDFAPIVPELQLPEELKVRFIFPHAPPIPVTVNGGYVMPAWFDIFEMDIDRKVDTKQLVSSAEKIEQLVDREIERGIASDRIILAGFSQGGAVAYQLSLTYHKPLCGLLAMSTYFATSETISLHDANKNLPIAIQHGASDQVVPEALGIDAMEKLTEIGYSPEYRTYPMEHSVCPQQVVDVSQWFQKLLMK